MSDYTKVNSSAMQQGVADLKQAHSALEEQLSTLESELNSSLAQWEGAAQGAYRAAKAQWDQAANHMAQVITTMSSTMSQIGENYDANEKHLESNWA